VVTLIHCQNGAECQLLACSCRIPIIRELDAQHILGYSQGANNLRGIDVRTRHAMRRRFRLLEESSERPTRNRISNGRKRKNGCEDGQRRFVEAGFTECALRPSFQGRDVRLQLPSQHTNGVLQSISR
jgi:hypothetical protein